MRALGSKTDGSPFTVAVADPADENAYLGTVALTDASLVTAGGYQRYFEQDGAVYHHILDPKTGLCADSGLLGATVLCTNGARADALSTALFVLGEAGALKLWQNARDFEYLLVTDDGRILVTPGMDALFSPAADSSYRVACVS